MNRRFQLSAIYVSTLLLAGCAADKQMTREEWLQYTTHTYAGVSKEQALAAAEKLFILADGDDFSFEHHSDGILATRKWSYYAVIAAGFGTDHWKVKAVENGSGVNIEVELNIVSGAFLQSTMSVPPKGNATYDLFWRRMDYLLGESTKWINCEQAAKLNDGVTVWGKNDALCDMVTIKDNSPS